MALIANKIFLMLRNSAIPCVIAALIVLVVGCDGAPVADNTSSLASSSASSSDSSQQLCSAPADLQLSDIASVVEWINAMPKPLSLACFIKSLNRPLFYNASESIFSAQPSVGRRSPRVFFLIDDLILTITPDESYDTIFDPELGSNIKDPETGFDKRFWDVDGFQLLELSQEVGVINGVRQSIKGELKFPVETDVPPNAPFVGINLGNQNKFSVCAICHLDETQIDIIDGQSVYRSSMIRPETNAIVSLDFMLNEYATCDPTTGPNEWYRCEMLEAIYGQGTLIWKSFDQEIPTFFD
jgi:hypothetical protein